MLLQFIINGFITGLIYSLMAVGFALVYNTTHTFHIAAAGFYVFAAYLFWLLSVKVGFPIALSAVFAIVLTMVLSLLSEVIIYSPLRKRHSSPNSMMIASVGLMTVIVNLIAMLFGNETKVVEAGVLTTCQYGDIVITTPQIWQAAVSALTMTALTIILRFTKFGKKIRAISADETLFDTLGYNKRKFYYAIFLVSGFFIGLTSCLTVYDVGLDPNMGMTVLINAMVAMIIGGVGNLNSCILGGIALGILQSLTTFCFASNWQNAVTFAILIGFLFFCPEGIDGTKRRVV